MWYVWLSVVTTLIIVYITTHCVYLWRNPKCSGSGKLPPGSMGFPLIGETFEFFTKSKSLDIPSFIKKRITKYGPLFKTSLVGRPIVISTDAETNFYLLQQGEKTVEVWYMDSFEKLMLQDTITENNTTISTGYIHKYIRNIALKHFGPESIKEKLLPLLEESISQRLHAWSKLPSLEVKCATTAFAYDCTAKLLFGYDADKSGESIGDSFSNFIQGMMSVPLNIPGTTFHKSLKNRKKVIDMMKKEMQERKANPEIRKGDFLDHITQEMNKEKKFITEDFIVFLLFIYLVASFESISSTLTVALMSLTDHPTVVQELMEEHEAILTSRRDADSGVTWEEYKSMTFTHHVISESLRLGNVSPGLMRRAVRDITINGYTIPKGWAIMVVPSAIQLNPDNYEDPLVFNPWRWKHIQESVAAKRFIPFGGGSVMCPGAELSKVMMAMFLHKLVTKYRWTKLKGGKVVRTPLITFGDGFHIQVYEKE